MAGDGTTSVIAGSLLKTSLQPAVPPLPSRITRPPKTTAQDVVAGDGTTSVTVIAGSLLKKSLELLEKGVHPTIISDAFQKAAQKACEVRAAEEGGGVRVWRLGG